MTSRNKNSFKKLVFATFEKIIEIHTAVNSKRLSSCYAETYGFAIAPTGLPEFSRSPLNTTKNEGENVTLLCNATGEPNPTIIWMKDGSKLNASADSTVSVSQDETQLIIRNLTRNNEGFYQCVANNSEGNISSYPALLTVRCKYYAIARKIDSERSRESKAMRARSTRAVLSSCHPRSQGLSFSRPLTGNEVAYFRSISFPLL